MLCECALSNTGNITLDHCSMTQLCYNNYCVVNCENKKNNGTSQYIRCCFQQSYVCFQLQSQHCPIRLLGVPSRWLHHLAIRSRSNLEIQMCHQILGCIIDILRDRFQITYCCCMLPMHTLFPSGLLRLLQYYYCKDQRVKFVNGLPGPNYFVRWTQNDKAGPPGITNVFHVVLPYFCNSA